MLQIINAVRDEINRLYDAFCSRNPYFKEKYDKVSIVAHSLGSVITYDILSLWDIEERNLTENELPTGTGFLTESFTYLKTLASREELQPSSSSDDFSSTPSKRENKFKPKENIRVELAKARNNVMELEAMLKAELQIDENKENSSGESDCPYALRFKVKHEVGLSQYL